MKSAFLLSLLALGFTSCNSPQGTPIHRIAAEINETLVELPETVTAGDTLEVTFVNLTSKERPDFSRPNLVVPQDGLLHFPALKDPVQAEGKTVEEIAQALKSSYASVLGSSPSVAVSRTGRPETMFHILGAVEKPASYVVDSGERVTLVEALAKAGGTTYLTSYMGNVLLVRQNPEKTEMKSWVLDARPKWWGRPQSIILQSGDVVYVPTTTVANVNTWLERYVGRMIPLPPVVFFR